MEKITIGHFKNVNGERDGIFAIRTDAQKWDLALGDMAPIMYDINSLDEVRANVRLLFWHPFWELTFNLDAPYNGLPHMEERG